MSGAADDLLATLTAAEASLRAVVASAFAPDVVMRIERDSSRAARQAVASLSAGRTLELPIGWSEYVDVDEALDALLARHVPTERAPATVRAAAPAPAKVTPPPPPAFRQPEVREVVPPPTFVIGLDEPAAPPAWTSGLPDATFVDDEDDMVEEIDALEDDVSAAPAPASRWEAFDEDDEDEATIIGSAEDRAAIQSGSYKALSESPKKAVADDDAWVSYVPQPVAEVDFDELEERKATYHDDGVDYITYVEPAPVPYEPTSTDTEPLPAYASGAHAAVVEDEKPPVEEHAPTSRSRSSAGVEPVYIARQAPVVPKPDMSGRPLARQAAREAAKDAAREPVASTLPPTELQSEDEWSFVASGQEEVERPGSHDPYAVMRKERMRLDDFSAVDEAEEAMLAAAERAVSAAVEADRTDDEDAPTTVRRSAGRSHAAAIQLTGEGGPRILGLDEDDDDDDSVIELGDTRDYGEDDGVEDDQTGILGVGVVEYDDELEDADEEEEDEDDNDGRLQPSLGPGAPVLTPAEVSALFAKAQAVARRDMTEGVKVFSDVLDADPDRVDALLARGRLSLDLGDFPASVSDFLKAEALTPADADVLVALGDLFFNRKDYGKAVFYFNRAITLDDGHATAYARRGMAHYYRKQYIAAVEDLEKAKKLDPSLAMVDSYLTRSRKRQ